MPCRAAAGLHSKRNDINGILDPGVGAGLHDVMSGDPPAGAVACRFLFDLRLAAKYKVIQAGNSLRVPP